MNLIRLIAIAVLFWLLYRLILALLRKAQRPSVQQPPPQEGSPMVRCAHCGLHVPKNHAIEKDGKYYCGKEHRDATDSWKRDE